MSNDVIKVILSAEDVWNKERREIGEIAGIKFFADSGLPDDEVRVIRDGKIIAKFRI